MGPEKFLENGIKKSGTGFLLYVIFCGLHLAKWLERLTANAQVSTVLGLTSNPSVLRHIGLGGGI